MRWMLLVWTGRGWLVTDTFPARAEMLALRARNKHRDAGRRAEVKLG